MLIILNKFYPNKMQRTVRQTNVPLFTLFQEAFDHEETTRYYLRFDTPLTILGSGETTRNGMFAETKAMWVDNVGSMEMTIDPEQWYWRRRLPIAHFYSASDPTQLIGMKRILDEYNIYYLLGQVAPYVSFASSIRDGITSEYDLEVACVAPPVSYWPTRDVYTTQEFHI